MWQPLSQALEILGRIRIRFDMLFRTGVAVGDVNAPDARGGADWKRYVSGESLYDVWGPLPDSQWAPFHCIPLFAALDRVDSWRVGPAPPQTNGKNPPHAAPGAPAPVWMATDALTIIDLPGRKSVETAAWLISAYPCQPVCTFNNWPNPKGLLRAEMILAELLRWASTVAAARQELQRTSPPLWICDSERLGSRKGNPGEFDNRYFLEDTVLPGATYLRSAGIGRVVYITANQAEAPVIDLDGWFFDLEAAGVPVRIVDINDPTLALREWITRPPRSFSSGGFSRTAAGGFGTTVPQPSSGGG